MAPSRSWVLLTGEYPPQPGGVSDYTKLVAEALAAAGDEVQVWCPPTSSKAAVSGDVQVHRLPDRFGLHGLSVLDVALARLPRNTRVLVQYVPQAFGFKAMNLPFCLWLASLRRQAVWVMFHEVAVAVGRGQRLRHNLLGGVHRLMAWLIHRSSARSFISVPGWEGVLRRLVPGAKCPEWLPVPSNLPTEVDPERIAAYRQRVGDGVGRLVIGHFGTLGASIREFLSAALPPLLLGRNDRQGLLVGRDSEAFAGELMRQHPSLQGCLMATGTLEENETAVAIAACDLLLQPYPDGASTRRTSLMAGLALGVPIVTTEGRLSEPLWRESNAVALVPSDSPATAIAVAESLLADEPRRLLLGTRGRSLYRQQFSLEHLVLTLRA